MVRIYLSLVLLLLGSASAQDAPFAEGFSLAKDQDVMIVGYDAHTVTSLLEFVHRGVLVDQLDVSPLKIGARVGEKLELSQIRVTAFNSHGEVVDSVPLRFYLDGPKDLLDLEGFRTHGDAATAIKSGVARIWVEAVPRSRAGKVLRVPIELLVE